MKYKLRLSRRTYDPAIKGFRERYILAKNIDGQQAQAILKLLEAGKVAGGDHGARGRKGPLLQGTQKVNGE